MSEAEPIGCLAAILRLFGIKLGGSATVGGVLPYRQRDDFLSAAELSFYRVLAKGLNDSFVICPKVNLADIFFVARPNENRSYKNRIDRKHVDFLLCDPTTMKPILGVELDDSSHARRDRQDRDQFVDQVFEAAGLPLLRIRAAAGYNPQQIADQVRSASTGRAGIRMAVLVQEGTPICPKCDSQMVLRTAKKGGQQGEKFWGCSNYPKCRETLAGS